MWSLSLTAKLVLALASPAIAEHGPEYLHHAGRFNLFGWDGATSAEVQAWLSASCARDHPGNPQEQTQCEEQRRDALLAIGDWAGLPADVTATIERRCFDRWTVDLTMRQWCWSREAERFRRYRGY
jgi:hypothetical protein